jgi:hypothetical protein
MWKTLKLSSVGFDSGSKKFKRGYSGVNNAVWWSLGFAGAWSQDVGLCWCVLQEFGFSRRQLSLRYKYIL